MPLVQVAYNARIQQDNVVVMMDTKASNVMELVIVLLRAQVAMIVMLLQDNVIAKMGIQGPLATPVLPTSSKRVMEDVQVSQITNHTWGMQQKWVFCISACECDENGSNDLQCAASTGLCECKSGYKGDKCDSQCNCDGTGSNGEGCDQSTGQCACQDGYTGTTCDAQAAAGKITTFSPTV